MHVWAAKPQSAMRICIYGAGAMGTSLGARLLTEVPGCDFDFVTRNRAHVEALNAQGADLIGGSAQFRVRVHALLPEAMQGEYDVIFLATKQRDNAQIAAFLRPFLKEDGALVTVQNGLPEAGLAEVFGADRVYGCALGWGAELVSPGVIKLSSEGELCLSLGAYGRGEQLEELRTLLSRAYTVTVGNLSEIRYSKLAVNAAFSTLSAISGLSFGEIAKHHKKIALALMRETVSVAKAEGCRALVQNGHNIMKFAQSPFAGIILPIAMKRHRAIRSGMLRDLEAGRRCDIDFVAGAVVNAGERLGVPCTKLRRAVALVHEIENGLAELSPASIELLEVEPCD